MWCLLMGPAKIISLRSVEGLLKLMQILRSKIFFLYKKIQSFKLYKKPPFLKKKNWCWSIWWLEIFYFLFFIYLAD